MKKITARELENILVSLHGRGATFVTIKTETDARLRKTGNPFSDVRKRSVVNGVIGWNYANSVNNQRKREGQPTDDEGNVEAFEALPRKWGQRIPRSPLVVHKGKLYLELKVEKTLVKPEYVVSDSGESLTPEQVAPFLPKRSDKGRQGVDKPVILRDYRLDSIREIRVNGETMTVA